MNMIIEENPIRVLHVLHGLDRGGIETFIVNIYRNINKERVQFDFAIVETKECDYEREIKMLGGKIYRLPNPNNPLRFFSQAFPLFKNYKIIHSHWNTVSAEILFIACLAGCKVRIAHSHIAKTSSGFKGKLKTFLRPFVRIIASDYFACGYDAGMYLYGKNIKNNPKFRIVNNAINAENFVYSEDFRKRIRDIYNIHETTTIIGHVGRFSDQKNHFFILKIFEKFLQKKPNSELWLIGEGPLKQSVEKYIKTNKLTDKVRLIGNIPNVNEYLSAFDIYLFPSLYEGLSVSLIEAQTAGLRCICSNTIDINSKVTNLVDFFPLEMKTEEWANCIYNAIDYTRENQFKQIEQFGYNMRKEVAKLESFYLKKGMSE